MSLLVEVFINNKQIAYAMAQNVFTDEHGISDYGCVAWTEGYDALKLPSCRHEFNIEEHARAQSPWVLIAKMATYMAEQEEIVRNEKPMEKTQGSLENQR